MNYEVGKQYEMRVAGIQKDSAGHDFIALYDDSGKDYRVYNILKCQWEGLPETLYVIVKSIDAFGKIKFRQDEGRLFQEHYKLGKLYAFEVIDVKEDYNSGKPYYVIEDDFASHHYYFQGDQKYKVGEDCTLEVSGFTDKGFLKLKEVDHSNQGQSVESAAVTPKDNTQERLATLWGNLPVLDVGEESQTLELKTSIAFPPGEGKPNIDKQLFNILKELTAFMNTDGGTLYIGIHDKTKKVIGIESDYQYLNDGEDDFNGSYGSNVDGYQLKIRNTMDRLCPSLANSLTTVSFESLDGREYCVITVKPARRPIFLDGNRLYVRQGNRVKLLKGEDITSFIYERMTISIREVLDTEGIQMNANTLSVEVLKQAMSTLINERRAVPRDLPKPKDLGEIDFWIIWYKDSSWERSRKKSDDPNVQIQVPVYKHISDPLVVFCYDTARVNTIKLKDFRAGVNLNKIQKNGWSRTGDIPCNIFIMHATDYLVGYSVDSDGIEKVKLHAISDYSPSNSAANQGGQFLPEGSRIEVYAVLGAEHKNKVAHLVVTKSKRSSDAGTPLSSPTLKDEIEYLEKALKQ